MKFSLLKGKIQNIKDSAFGNVPPIASHQNQSHQISNQNEPHPNQVAHQEQPRQNRVSNQNQDQQNQIPNQNLTAKLKTQK